MSIKTKLRVLISCLVLCALSPVALFYVIPYSESGPEWRVPKEVIAQPVVSKPVAARTQVPIHISIPRVGIEAPVDRVGVTEDGELGTPDDPARAGWFELGPRPGEKGSAVIDAHYGWVGDTAAAFDTLNKVVVGDRIYVKGESGSLMSFTVRETRVFEKDADATEVFVSKDGIARLNLITCHGSWNEDTQKYSGRLVVFAEKDIVRN